VSAFEKNPDEASQLLNCFLEDNIKLNKHWHTCGEEALKYCGSFATWALAPPLNVCMGQRIISSPPDISTFLLINSYILHIIYQYGYLYEQPPTICFLKSKP